MPPAEVPNFAQIRRDTSEVARWQDTAQPPAPLQIVRELFLNVESKYSGADKGEVLGVRT